MEAKHHSIQRRMVDAIDAQLAGIFGGTAILNSLDAAQLHAVRRFVLSFLLRDDDHAIDRIPVEPRPGYPSKVDEWRDAPEAPEDFQRGFQAWARIVNGKLHELERKLNDVNSALRAISEDGPAIPVTGASQSRVGVADGTRMAMLEDTVGGLSRTLLDNVDDLISLRERLDAIVDMLGEGSRVPGSLSYAARIGQLADQVRRLTELAGQPSFGWQNETDAGTLITAGPGDEVLLMANTRTMGGAVLKEQWAKVLHVDTENGRYQVELGNTLGTETRSIPWVDLRYIKDVSPAIDVRFPQEKLD